MFRGSFETFVCDDASQNDVAENDEATEDPIKPYENVELLTSMFRVQIDRLRDTYPDAAFEADYTSGTKPMSAALVNAAIDRNIHTLHYAVGPKDEAGRATITTGLATHDTLESIAERTLQRLGAFFNEGYYRTVAEQARELADQLPERSQLLRIRAETLGVLAEAYDHWERYEWNRAFDILSKCTGRKTRDDYAQAGWNIEVLQTQKSFVKAAGKKHAFPEPPPHERLIDLWRSARQCEQSGRFDDALARLYRLTEYIGQARLGAKGIDVSKQIKPEDLEEIAPEFARKNLTKPAKLGLVQVWEILVESGDDVGKKFVDLYGPFGQFDPKRSGPLRKALDQRNNSYLAHGTTPAKKETVTELINYLKELLALHTGSSVHSLDWCNFLKCPWVG